MGHATADGEPAPAASDVPTDDQAGAAAAMFSMLAHPTRLKLLWLLGSEELDVTSLAARARTSPAVASQHLAKLRLGGFVVQRTSGRRRLYSADGSHLRALIREALYRADHEVTGVPDHG